MSERKRRRFSSEFKAEAVRRWIQSGLSGAEMARELEIRPNLLYRWRAEAETEMPAEEVALADEVRRLRAEVTQLRRDKEILEKATAIFAEYRK